MSESQKIVLITGANRGLGLGMTRVYLERGWKVIAAVRDITSMPKLDGIIVIKIDASSIDDPVNAVRELKEKHGIHHIDVVIANAARGDDISPISQITPESLEQHFNVNARGPLLLFQATRNLLLAISAKSAGGRGEKGKFVVISSYWAKQSRTWHFKGMSNYGTSKAALNYIARAIHFEEPDLISFPIEPGYVETGLGETASEVLLGRKPTQTVEETAPGIIDVIEKSTKEETSGNWWKYDGTPVTW